MTKKHSAQKCTQAGTLYTKRAGAVPTGHPRRTNPHKHAHANANTPYTRRAKKSLGAKTPFSRFTWQARIKTDPFPLVDIVSIECTPRTRRSVVRDCPRARAHSLTN